MNEIENENDKITEYAYAKVNLLLDATDKRPDGYHNLNSVLVPLNIYDTITIEKADQMSYSCDDESLPFDSSNTVVKAVKLMKKTFHIKDNYRITVNKAIPMQAGLGGGSSDAAAVMRGIVKLSNIETELPYLQMLALEIGADVPACLAKKCTLVSGIGQVKERLDRRFDLIFLLIKPEQGISTKLVYENLNLETCAHPCLETFMDEWRQGNAGGVLKQCGNSLEDSTFQLVEGLADLKQELLDCGFPCVNMCGSGTTIFATGKSMSETLEIAEKFKGRYPFVKVTTTYPAPLSPSAKERHDFVRRFLGYDI